MIGVFAAAAEPARRARHARRAPKCNSARSRFIPALFPFSHWSVIIVPFIDDFLVIFHFGCRSLAPVSPIVRCGSFWYKLCEVGALQVTALRICATSWDVPLSFMRVCESNLLLRGGICDLGRFFFSPYAGHSLRMLTPLSKVCLTGLLAVAGKLTSKLDD